jgi:hypothetical protein
MSFPHGKTRRVIISLVAFVLVLVISNGVVYGLMHGQAINLQRNVEALNTQLDSSNSQIDSLDEQVESLNMSVNTSRVQLDELNATYLEYTDTHSNSDVDYEILYWKWHNLDTLWYPFDQLKQVRLPKLVAVILSGSDNRSTPEEPFLYVTGSLINVGCLAALRSTLHVVAYSNESKSIEEDIDLGTISWGTVKTIDCRISYTGDALTNWNMTSHWCYNGGESIRDDEGNFVEDIPSPE